jgi:hypothetical protein
MIKHSTLTHGDPAELASLLDDEELDESQLRAVIINLLNRVARLEALVTP